MEITISLEDIPEGCDFELTTYSEYGNRIGIEGVIGIRELIGATGKRASFFGMNEIICIFMKSSKLSAILSVIIKYLAASCGVFNPRGICQAIKYGFMLIVCGSK